MKVCNVLVVVSVVWGLFACNAGTSRAKLSGQVSLRLADGSPISQSATTEYNPYIVKMPDGYLVLVFGSDRSCAGCSAGTHNVFIARSVAAYNNDQKLPAFNSPAVLTLAATPLNYAGAITFAATQNGANLRIYLNNAQGVIQYADFLATAGTFNTASFTSIVNSVWRRLTIVGIDDVGTGLYGRSSNGQVYWLNPAILNIALTSMPNTGLSAVARVAPAQTGIQDSYITLQNGTVSTSSYSSASATVTKLQTTLSTAKVAAKSLSIAHTGNAAGDFIVVSAADTGQTAQDLYVVEGVTPVQIWSDLSSKPASGISALPSAVTGVYAWYELDGNRNDVSGSGNHATLSMGAFTGVDPTYTATDRFGSPNAAATFNGTSQYMLNSFLAKCDESFSVSLWIKPAQVAAQRSLMGYQTGPLANPGFTLNTEAGGGIAAQSFFNGTGANTANTYGVTAAGQLIVGQWRHIVYVNDAATRLGVIYVNGVALANTAHAGSDCPILGGPCTCSGTSPVTGQQQWWSAAPMTIGYAYRGYFQGDLDQVAFFNRKLTAAEIQVLATQ
ncbi:MAG: LamG domain-containing protein [Leptospiraceae bacterium]|nr:LamG domain-containing protein [Leptospiraceae bacterium]